MSVATEIEDPFREFAPPSLLSQTLAASLGSQSAALGPGGAESIRSIFESMGIKGSTTQLVGQAQTIVNSSTNLENLYNEDGDGPVAPSDKNCAQERRPALGRKRAKFSLKPVPSHSLPTIDMSSSINHIEDPEEYFLAVEQLENADKELKKLRGETSTNLVQHPNTIARKRRPGLLGKTVSYKHQFSTNDVATEVLVEAQESETSDGIELKLSNVSPSITTDRCSTLQTKITDNKRQDATEREGLVVDEDKKANILLENLLSSFKELDEDEGETLLRESLQVKSIDVGKICLPDLGTIQRLDCNALDSRVTRGQLKASQFSQTPPTLGKSPFVGIAALQRRASLKDPHRDLYGPPSDDKSCSEDSSLSSGLGRKSLSPLVIDSHDKCDLIGSGALSPATENGVQLSFVDKMHSPVVEAYGITNGKITSDKKPPEDSPHSLNRNTGHCSDGFDIDKDIVSTDLDVCSQEEQGNDIQVDPSVVDHQDAGVGGLNSGSTSYTRTEDLANSPHRDMGENCSNSDINNDTVLGYDDTSHTEAHTTVEDHTLSLQVVKDSSIPSQETLVLNQDQDGLPTLPTRNDEMASEASPNRRNEKANRRWNRKAVAHRDKKTSISRRQSLAGAGTIWDPESGRRRSTRTKCKPLEYWRGERFLYARIHDSLTTVIGVKRASPGKPGLQVKSFVSDQYEDLVAQAALH